MSATSFIEQVFQQKGVEAAYQEACDEIRRQAEERNALWASRFFERRVLDDGSKKLWPVTEAAISRHYDLQDLDGAPVPEFFYCDEDGNLFSVIVGKQESINTDEECPFVYASSDMVANGKLVGHVMYTDH